MPKGKGYKKGKKRHHSSRHKPVGGMTGNAASRLSGRQRQIDQALEAAEGRQTTDSNN